MDVAIHATVMLELIGGDHAPGVVEGGILSQSVLQLNIEALPGDIPDTIQHDVSGLEMNSTELLSAVKAPKGVTFLDDLDETVVASVTPPTAEPVEDEIETETGVVGEGAAPAEGDAAEEAGEPAESSDES
jgi:large subunit ribosomal protein L25